MCVVVLQTSAVNMRSTLWCCVPHSLILSSQTGVQMEPPATYVHSHSYEFAPVLFFSVSVLSATVVIAIHL